MLKVQVPGGKREISNLSVSSINGSIIRRKGDKMGFDLYTKIEGIDKEVSRILLGTGFLPDVDDYDAWLTGILDTGVNAIDTARVYPDSEKTIGKWLEKTGVRDKVVILSKCGHPDGSVKRVNRRAMLADLDKSLEELRTDYIDIYILHRDDPSVEVAEVIETFNEMKARGKIGLFGGSNWTYRRIEEANEYAYKKGLEPFSVSSPSFGLADQLGVVWDDTCVTISGKAGEEARKWYAQNQMPVVAYSSLGRGLFSGRLKSTDADNAEQYLDMFAMRGYAFPDNFERLRRCEILAKEKEVSVPQLAMSWIFHQKMNMFAVVSTSSPVRMQENIKALAIDLSEKESDYLNLVSDLY